VYPSDIAATIEALEKALAGLRSTGPSGTADNSIAAQAEASDDERTPMIWIAQPVRHHQKFRVWFKPIEGPKTYKTFLTEGEALAFIAKTRKVKGTTAKELVASYIASRQDLTESSRKTLAFRLGAMITTNKPIEGYPFQKRWNALTQSVDSRHGIRSALRRYLAWCVKAGHLEKPPALDLEIVGRKRTGKEQLRLDEAKSLFDDIGNSDSLMAVTAIVLGLRPGELVALRPRDLDADGTLLHVPGTKTVAAKRTVEVAASLRPHLLALQAQRGEYLFSLPAERERTSADTQRARVDAFRRRFAATLKRHGLPKVLPHSLRGLHATLATAAGATAHSVAQQLGHVSPALAKRHYIAPGTPETANSNAAQSRLAAPAR